MTPAFARTFGLAVLGLLGVAGLVAVAIVVGLYESIETATRAKLLSALASEAVPVAALVLLVIIPLALWIASVRQRQVASLEAVKHDLDVILHANPAYRLDPPASRQFADVCRGINQLADRAGGLPAGPRPEYFGYDLFGRGAAGLGERRLADLTFTVFDTETTGLDPAGGDEIVAVGAVRVVRGKVDQEDVFDRLVDPRRPIPALATRIHGIDAGLVSGAPGIEIVLPELRRFAGDTVLAGHNVAFDLRFFEIKSAAAGAVFDMVVVDTLILASIVDPREEADHTLEALARRYGVPQPRRHHALSDAFTTAEVLTRLVQLLAQRGIVTLEQALSASKRSRYARVRY